jgi:hypothetical protein
MRSIAADRRPAARPFCPPGWQLLLANQLGGSHRSIAGEQLAQGCPAALLRGRGARLLVGAALELPIGPGGQGAELPAAKCPAGCCSSSPAAAAAVRCPLQVTTIMVVGAGRAPLVRASLAAAQQAGRRVKVWAVEKNPNAVVTIQHLIVSEGWQDTVGPCGSMRLLPQPAVATPWRPWRRSYRMCCVVRRMQLVATRTAACTTLAAALASGR